MKLALKYVIVETEKHGDVHAFCLAPMHHKELADSLVKQFPGSIPVSAGFVTFLASGAAVTFGHSESLQLKSRPIDGTIIGAIAKAQAFASPYPEHLAVT